MTRQLDSTSPLEELARLARIPDEEQRGIAFRELLRRHGRSEEITAVGAGSRPAPQEVRRR